MKKILFFHPKNDFTGSTRVLCNVISSEYSENEIVVITDINEGAGFLSGLENVKQIGLFNPKINGKNIPFVSFLVKTLHAFLLTYFIGRRYETFYLNTITPFYAALVGHLLRKKIIYHVHEKFVDLSFPKNLMEHVFNITPSHRIFVSKYTMSQYPINSLCTDKIIYNKLDSCFFKGVRVLPYEKHHCKKIVMICSFTKAKGIFNFVKLASTLTQYEFLLILSSSEEDIKEFRAVNAFPNLKIFSRQENVQPFLEKVDLILNLSIPSLWIETFGMTILEAMAYGIPAIVPNVGGVKELVEDGFNGFCLDVTDVDLVAQRINYILRPENYRRFYENSLIRFKEFV